MATGTAPIPISPNSHPSASAAPPTTTPSSTMSVSPQTPFFPPPGIAATAGSLPTPTQSNGLFKWAASLGKPPIQQKGGFDFQPVIEDHEHEHEHEHEHDSFEFGDFNDLKSRSWTGGGHGKRSVSMSFASGQSGIAAMLKAGQSLDAQQQQQQQQQHQQQAGALPSRPAGGVIAENAAKGQGVLRRLSLSGTSFTRPSFLSPPLQSAPLPPSPPALSNNSTAPISVPPPPPPSAAGPPQADPGAGAGIHRAATLAAPGAAGRGRRYSENGGAKKRGVSPMGERILRDHGHF